MALRLGRAFLVRLQASLRPLLPALMRQLGRLLCHAYHWLATQGGPVPHFLGGAGFCFPWPDGVFGQHVAAAL